MTIAPRIIIAIAVTRVTYTGDGYDVTIVPGTHPILHHAGSAGAARDHLFIPRRDYLMDFDHLCTPMRGHDMSEMGHMTHGLILHSSSPDCGCAECAALKIGASLTLPGATAAYIAKLEAQVEALKDKLSTETRALELASEGYMRAIGERDQAKARVAEQGSTIRRLADELASYKAAFAEAGLEMYPGEYWVEVPNEPVPLFEAPGACATARAFSVPALMSGPYMGED